MKNFAQNLFALAMVGQSLAAGMSPPLLVRSAHMLSNLNPGLGRREAAVTYSCPVGSYQCAGASYCCDIGSVCLPQAKCSGACGTGGTECYGSCCKAGYACQGPDLPCLKVDSSTITDTISMPVTNTISKPITTSEVPIPGTTLSKAMTSSTTLAGPSTTIPTIPKPTTSSTTVVNPYPTYTPMPPTTVKGNYTNTTSANPGSSSVAVVPLNGGNSLQPAGWLGGFGMALFLVFFHM